MDNQAFQNSISPLIRYYVPLLGTGIVLPLLDVWLSDSTKLWTVVTINVFGDHNLPLFILTILFPNLKNSLFRYLALCLSLRLPGPIFKYLTRDMAGDEFYMILFLREDRLRIYMTPMLLYHAFHFLRPLYWNILTTGLICIVVGYYFGPHILRYVKSGRITQIIPFILDAENFRICSLVEITMFWLRNTVIENSIKTAKEKAIKSSPKQVYQYGSLKDDEIRLLLLRSKTWNEEVSIFLREHT
jgi:hypothetical protein